MSHFCDFAVLSCPVPSSQGYGGDHVPGSAPEERKCAPNGHDNSKYYTLLLGKSGPATCLWSLYAHCCLLGYQRQEGQS